MGRTLNLLDMAFLAIESRQNPAHVAGLQIFDLPAGVEGIGYIKNLIADMHNSGAATAPFNQRLSYGLNGMPRWVEDENFDLDYHLRHTALPHTGSMEDLMRLIGRLHGQLLDRSRPLWEIYIIEGLSGGRFAMYTRIHHALVDGVTGIKMVEKALDVDPSAPLRVVWQQGQERSRSGRARPLASTRDRILKGIGGFRVGVDLAAEVAGILGMVGGKLVGTSKSTSPAPFTAPKSAFNVNIHASRKLSVSSLVLSEIKEVGRAADATVNDVVLAICAGALRKFMLEQGILPEADMSAVMPVSVRRENTDNPGNNISYVFTRLGTNIEGSKERMDVIRRSAGDAKQEAARMSAAGAMGFAAVAQGTTAAIKSLKMAELLPPPANLVVSNVPGPREALYMKGALLKANFPISALVDGQAVNITVTSYDGSMDFGVIASRDVVPDLDKLTDYIGVAFEDLRQEFLDASTRSPAKANELS